MQTLVFWPNVDAGSEATAKGIRMFREMGRANGFHFFRNLPPERFVGLMRHASAMIGNSSAALREGAFLGNPAVTIGSRQRNREHAVNVLRAGYDRDQIAAAIAHQVGHGRYEPDHMFGDGSAGSQIAEHLAGPLPPIQKELAYRIEDLLAEV